METIDVYSNPRRKRRMRRRSRSRGKRRRNPSELAILNPRRGRRRGGGTFRRKRRAHRNPRQSGLMGKIPFLGIGLGDLMYMGIGVVGASFGTKLLRKNIAFLEKIPSYLVDVGVGFALSKLAGNFLFKSRDAERGIMLGAIAIPLVQIFQGLGAKMGLGQGEYINSQDFEGIGYYTTPGSGNGDLVPQKFFYDRTSMFQDQN